MRVRYATDVQSCAFDMRPFVRTHPACARVRPAHDHAVQHATMRVRRAVMRKTHRFSPPRSSPPLVQAIASFADLAFCSVRFIAQAQTSVPKVTIGEFCARKPNVWHVWGMGARRIPLRGMGAWGHGASRFGAWGHGASRPIRAPTPPRAVILPYNGGIRRKDRPCPRPSRFLHASAFTARSPPSSRSTRPSPWQPSRKHSWTPACARKSSGTRSSSRSWPPWTIFWTSRTSSPAACRNAS